MSPATLVERLRPKHVADEPLARAVVSDDYAERRASVSAYLVANNALKSEAAASIEALAAERDKAIALVSSSEAERYRSCSALLARAETAEASFADAVKALEPFAEVADRFDGRDGIKWGDAYRPMGPLTLASFRAAAAIHSRQTLETDAGQMRCLQWQRLYIHRE